MKLPQKVRDAIQAEAEKNAHFSWYSGWEKSSGYIKSELRGANSFGSARIYIKWEKKKEPTEPQIKEAISKYIDSLLTNQEHHGDQRDFRYYVLNNYYVDVRRLQKEVILSVEDCLPVLLEALQKSELFIEPKIQNLFNDLKNFEAAVDDHAAIAEFLDVGRKRIGEA